MATNVHNCRLIMRSWMNVDLRSWQDVLCLAVDPHSSRLPRHSEASQGHQLGSSESVRYSRNSDETSSNAIYLYWVCRDSMWRIARGHTSTSHISDIARRRVKISHKIGYWFISHALIHAATPQRPPQTSYIWFSKLNIDIVWPQAESGTTICWIYFTAQNG